ncbi:MAG TPA: N-formylglutamate amidohydrolase, partial [Acidiphilium sp.]
VRRNDPYAGGYVTRHYGRPRERVHVLQIEIAKPLYMDEKLIAPNAGFATLQAILGRVISLVAEAAEMLV